MKEQPTISTDEFRASKSTFIATTTRTYKTPSPCGYSLFEKRESFIKKNPLQTTATDFCVYIERCYLHRLWSGGKSKYQHCSKCHNKYNNSNLLQQLFAFLFSLALALLGNTRLALLLYCHYLPSFKSSAMLSSSSCAGSRTEGASIIVSRPELFLGKAMQSRIESKPAKRLTQRSRP